MTDPKVPDTGNSFEINYHPVNQWQANQAYDVLITDAGITGITTALLLQIEGRKCILADTGNIIQKNGYLPGLLTTIPDIGAIERTHNKENLRSIAITAREAIDLIEYLVIKYEIDCGLQHEPAYLIANKDTSVAQLDMAAAAAVHAGIIISAIEHVPLPLPFKKAYRTEFQARINPVAYVAGLLKAFEQEGGVILNAATPSKNVKATQLVTSSGENSEPLTGHAIAFTLNTGTSPAALISNIDAPAFTLSSRTIGGREYIIADSYSNHQEQKNDAQHYDMLESYLRQYLDIASIDHKWSYQYHKTNYNLPPATAVTGVPDTFAFYSAGKEKMITGTITAQRLLDLMLEKESTGTSFSGTYHK